MEGGRGRQAGSVLIPNGPGRAFGDASIRASGVVRQIAVELDDVIVEDGDIAVDRAGAAAFRNAWSAGVGHVQLEKEERPFTLYFRNALFFNSSGYSL